MTPSEWLVSNKGKYCDGYGCGDGFGYGAINGHGYGNGCNGNGSDCATGFGNGTNIRDGRDDHTGHGYGFAPSAR